jgi:hypothetical protein
LKIKLTQNAPTAPTQPAKSEVAAPAAESKKSVAAPAKRISITCVKGKITRKVSGTAPKCPTGFKKR